MRALRRLQREQEPKSPYSLRSGIHLHHGRLCPHGRAYWRGGKARVQSPPHMLRHACGFALAAKGHDTRALQAYLGHKNIQHTVRYTELSPTRFKTFWR
jgi:integrase